MFVKKKGINVNKNNCLLYKTGDSLECTDSHFSEVFLVDELLHLEIRDFGPPSRGGQLPLSLRKMARVRFFPVREGGANGIN